MLIMVATSHNNHKTTNQATLFDWREEICLCSGGEIMTTSYSHLGCISLASSKFTTKICLFRCNKQQAEGEQHNFKQLGSRHGVMSPGKMPVPHNECAQIRG